MLEDRRALCPDWCDKAVSAARDRFDVARDVGIIAERVPHLANSYTQAVVELDKGVLRPKALPYLFPGDDLSTPFHEHDQQTVGKLLHLHRVAIAREAALAWVKFERTEAVFRCR